jgi:ferrous iron transport protein B
MSVPSRAARSLPSRVILVGNPNVGKSVLFGHLTKTYATVSNYPGTTVELSTAPAAGFPDAPAVVDTPGVNSLTPLSEDERVTRDLLLDAADDAVVVQVADAKNLRRALLVSMELADLEVPFVLALNMKDEAEARGIAVDAERLAEALGVPVVETVATRRSGIDALERAIAEARPAAVRAPMPATLESALGEATAMLPPALRGRRGVAGMSLAGDADLAARLEPLVGEDTSARLLAIRKRLAAESARSVAGRFARARLREADRLLASCYRQESPPASRSAPLGRLTTHPVWGVPVVLLILWLTYEIVGVFGAGTAVDFLENTVFGRYLLPPVTSAAAAIPSALVRDLLVGEYGLVTMALTYALAIVLPIVFFFFVIFGLLEDSGYLPRLALMMNRPMKALGLNGKAVLPMVLGLGCDTMATLTTRILETKKEKILATFLLALAVPCSAQLAVVLALTSRLSIWATVIWAGVVLATMFVVGAIAARIVPGSASDFILELPPLRVPSFGNILRKTLARLEWYLKEAVPLFLLGTLLLFVMSRVGLLGALERLAAPVVVHVLSLPPEAAAAFVVGFLRRDYGAVYLGDSARAGDLSGVQILVALVTLTLFVPCVANYFIMIKERGWKTATAMLAFIFPFAAAVGGALNWALRALRVSL